MAQKIFRICIAFFSKKNKTNKRIALRLFDQRKEAETYFFFFPNILLLTFHNTYSFSLPQYLAASAFFYVGLLPYGQCLHHLVGLCTHQPNVDLVWVNLWRVLALKTNHCHHQNQTIDWLCFFSVHVVSTWFYNLCYRIENKIENNIEMVRNKQTKQQQQKWLSKTNVGWTCGKKQNKQTKQNLQLSGVPN